MPPRRAAAPANPFLTPVAAATATDPPALVSPCCLRCSKRIHQWREEDDCGVLEHGERKCGYCSRAKHPCEVIPAVFNKRVNDLILRKRALMGADCVNDDAVHELREKVEEYESEVEAHIRFKNKEGVAPKALPSTMDAWAPVIARELKRRNDLEEQKLDIKRARLGMPPRASRAEPASRPGAEFAEPVEENPENLLEI